MITHKSPISGIATSKGKYIATAGYDNVVILWDAATRRSLARGCHDHLVNQCVFSHDGKFLATSSSDYTTRIWSIPNMRLHAVLNGHEDDVEGLSFHHSNEIIATCSRDKTIRLHSLSGELVKVLKGHTEDVISVEWMHKSEILISSSDDGTVKYWNTTSGEIIKDLSFNDVETDTIALTADGVIFAGNDDGEIVLIKNDEAPVMLPCHEAGIKRLVYAESVSKLISLSYDRTFKVWNYSDGSLILDSTHTFNNVVWPRSAAFLNAYEIVFASFGDRYAHFDLRMGEWVDNHISVTFGVNAVCEFNGNVYTVGDAGHVKKNNQVVNELGSLCNFIVPFGDCLVSGGQLGTVFNSLTGEVYYQHKSPLNCGAQFKVNGVEKLAIGTYTGEVVILQKINNVVTVDQIVCFHENAIKGVAVSENYIFTVCATGATAFHDIRTYKPIENLNGSHYKIANGCVYVSEDTFASISRDYTLRIWNETGVTVYNTGHKNSIKCISSDTSGKYLLLGDYIGYVSLFECTSNTFIKHIRLSDFGISNIGFNKETNQFLASSYNGKVYSVDVNPITVFDSKAVAVNKLSDVY